MLTKRDMFMGGAAALALGAAALSRGKPAKAASFPVTLTDAEWHSRLSPDQYAVLRKEATETPFSSPLLKEHRTGLFSCAGCQLDLFSSKTKFESGTGWPSFWAPLTKTAVGTTNDWSLGMDRTAVHCSKCGGHLGHVFSDGPRPTGLRYCMNGVALAFHPAQV